MQRGCSAASRTDRVIFVWNIREHVGAVKCHNTLPSVINTLNLLSVDRTDSNRTKKKQMRMIQIPKKATLLPGIPLKI